MKKLMSLEEEPPSSTSADPSLVLKPSPAFPTLNGHGFSSPVQLARAAGARFVISPASNEFRKRHFPGVKAAEWNDWRWQNRNRVRSLEQLERMIDVTPEERDAIARHHGPLPVGVTPYYMSLVDARNPAQGLRRTTIPTLSEFDRSAGEEDDPLGEDGHSPTPGLVHRYPDRVLLLVTNFCSVYCRYCTRARLVGASGERALRKADIDEAIDYIARTPAIRDCLISGGDPLSLDEDRLEYVLSRLRAIKHLEFIRIGSKQPVVQPMRVTPSLTKMLRRYHPLWMSLHFTHPDEVTPEVAEACGRLADAGIPLGSQTVLLKGVNDDVATLKKLFHELLKIRVRPYYLYQCDPISGSAHFRTPVEKGLELISQLRGYTTGYAVPNYVVDAPGGGGKIAMLPDPVLGRDGDDLKLRNFRGEECRYPDPGGKLGGS
ncbi:MAG TPA: KamA family radical SAM protein [Gammaproteobacteria bacterium]|nr:KamA family radical SAM protein [Gammaproteobacteria bacterium]